MERTPTMLEEFRAAWDRATRFERLRDTVGGLCTLMLFIALMILIASGGPK